MTGVAVGVRAGRPPRGDGRRSHGSDRAIKVMKTSTADAADISWSRSSAALLASDMLEASKESCGSTTSST